MSGIAPQLGLVLALVVINAVLAGSEIALVALRDSQIQRLEERHPRGRHLAALARDPNRYLATIQIGITLAGFLASATAAVTLAEPLLGPLGFLGAAARPVAIVAVTVALAYLTLVLGELAPKRIAMQRAEGWSLRAARPLDLFSTVTRPLVWLLGRSTDLVVRLAGVDPHGTADEVSEEELRDLIAMQADVSPEQRHILTGAFQAAERRLREIVVPRQQVVAVTSGTPADEALRVLKAAAHTRAPVLGVDPDEVHGVVHVLDLVGVDGPVDEHLRPAVVLPESMDVLDAIRQLQSDHQQLAVVADEHGSTEGIVTLEDLLEEIVGELWDEFDTDAERVAREPGGAVVLPGDFPVHDLAEHGVDLPEGPYATVAGYVLSRLGHLAAPGEVVEDDGWCSEVVATEGRAITRVRLVPLPDGGRDGEAPAGS